VRDRDGCTAQLFIHTICKKKTPRTYTNYNSASQFTNFHMCQQQKTQKRKKKKKEDAKDTIKIQTKIYLIKLRHLTYSPYNPFSSSPIAQFASPSSQCLIATSPIDQTRSYTALWCPFLQVTKNPNEFVGSFCDHTIAIYAIVTSVMDQWKCWWSAHGQNGGGSSTPHRRLPKLAVSGAWTPPPPCCSSLGPDVLCRSWSMSTPAGRPPTGG